MTSPGMVIVGAGECGTRAAFALREAGWTGPVTLVGAEPTLPYERPPLSKTWTLRPICDDDALRAAGITLLTGVSVVDLDPAAHRVTLSDGRSLGYRALLLATGARARRLPFAGVHLLRTHADATALRDRLEPGTRVGVVGGGFIGLELAAAARALGCAVTVVEAAPRVLGRAVPAPVAAVLADRHRAAGVDLRCGVGVTAADLTRFDVVVAGVGAEPETGLAAAAGIALSADGGIAVDARFATSAPDVYAAGDCCSYPHPLYGRIRLESWRAAQEHGTAAAGAMLGGGATYANVPWFWSDQYELGLQVVGLVGAASREVLRERADGVLVWFGLDADGRLVAAAGVGPGTSVARDIKVADMLIARRATPAAEALADPGVTLKALLRSPVAA
jgi:3-phenylpropionate/trans-cinnamate dioxygenase ferredoxin reductase subunit